MELLQIHMGILPTVVHPEREEGEMLGCRHLPSTKSKC